VLTDRPGQRKVTIAGDHPCLPGHFPGRPIVPAVVVLDEVRAMIADIYPGQRICSIDRCKFQDFVLPDHPFEVVLTVSDGGMVDFACHSADDNRLLANGRVRLETRSSAI